jgi:hypothetical protein
VGQKLNKTADTAGSVLIKGIRPIFPLEIIYLALASLLDILASQYLARNYIRSVFLSYGTVVALYSGCANGSST